MSALGTILSTSEVKETLTQTPADAAIINAVVTAGKNTLLKWTALQATILNISGTMSDGDELTVIILNDAVLPRTITFGTLLVSFGVVTGVAGKTSVVKFVSDGAKFIEYARTVGI